MTTRRFSVPRGAAGRLDAFLGRALPAHDEPQLKQLVASGAVRVNGKVAKPLRRLHGGETVEVACPAPQKVDEAHGPLLTALFENDAMVVVNKPAGVTVETERQQPLPSVAQLAATQFKGFDVGGLAAPGIVHRLDKETTGCLLLAKTDEALRGLLDDFEGKRVTKVYLAVVKGTAPEQQSLDTPYARDSKDPRRFTTREPSHRRARLSFRRREVFDGGAYSLLEIVLDTGRTHQIRAQLADIDLPVVGDALYGGPTVDFIGRVALHAARLTIDQAQRPLAVEAPIPADMHLALERLRGTPLTS